MEETGVVAGLEPNGYALVRVRNQQFFESPRCRGACQAFGGENQRTMTAINRGGAKVGDQVRMNIDSGAFLKASFVVYLLPVLALLLGAVVGKLCGAHIWCSENPDKCAALVGGICFGLSFGIMRFLNGRASRNEAYYPVIEQVIQFSDPYLLRDRG